MTGPWRDPALYASLGVPPLSGALLHGPPGCGKSLLASVIAAEGGANFVHVRSTELLSKWLGESERLVRRLFARARAAAPCVLFFDDIDALVGKRDLEGGGGALFPLSSSSSPPPPPLFLSSSLSSSGVPRELFSPTCSAQMQRETGGAPGSCSREGCALGPWLLAFP